MADFYVICFDIRDETRLTRVADTLENFGVRVQRSVFECYLSQREVAMLWKRLCQVADLAEDQIRYYQLCPRDMKRIAIDGPGEVTVERDFFLV